ncbi:MAG: hypothetical protein AAGC55_34665, partial [Myxococcota bacterium]
MVAGAAIMRQGAILRDHLGDRKAAVRCFESLAALEPGKLPALLALEPLYTEFAAWDALASAYRVEAETVSAQAARIAALRELARIQETRDGVAAERIAATYQAILDHAPDDQVALVALQRLASELGDKTSLAKIYRRLGKAVGAPQLAARYWTSMGHAREELGEPEAAMAAYRTAIDEDADCLAAIRGLSRTARAVGDARALADAWRREATLIGDARTAADLLVKSAILGLDELDDEAGAVRDLERALSLWPDSQAAAERLCGPLLAAGRADYLIDVLARAAGQASSPESAAEHWVRVAELRFEQQGDL